MAETQKGSSSAANSKEKTSLLDLDIGKDFLTSWKSMSVTEDDPMDFDFSTVPKGTKKTFNFDKADMDFTLDGDFDKISSFKVDMSDLDVSSPLKKAGKSKERSKKVSADENPQGKTDRFTFPFDFNEFDSLSFESSLVKKDKQSNRNQDREKSSSRSGCQVSGLHLNENDGALEDNIFLKHGASEGETTSKVDSQLGGEPDSSNKVEPLKSVMNENYLSKSATFEDIVGKLGAITSPEKSISSSTRETDQESFPPEKITSPESYAQENGQDVSVQSVFGNESTPHTATDLQEEVGSLAKKESMGIGGEQNVIVKLNDSGFKYENPQLDNLPPEMACSQSNNGEKRNFEGDNHVQIGHKDDAEPAQGDSQFEQTSITSSSGEFIHDTKADGETLDSTSEIIVSPLNSGITGDKAMPDKERETGVIRSKFFKKSDETRSQLKQSSLSQIKITTFGSKRIGTVKLSPADERKLDTKDAQSGSKLAALQRPLPRELTRAEPVQIRSKGSVKDLNTNREGFNADDAKTGSILTGTSRLHDKDVTKGELVSNGSENNVKDPNTSSWHVQASSLSEQADKSASQDCLNPRLPISGMKSIQNMKNIFADKNKISPLKTDGRTSDLPNLKNMRTIGANNLPLKSTFQKDIKSLTKSERSKDLKGNTESRMAHSADTKKQISSSPTLKRKTLEESSTDLLTMKPSKRLSGSPSESRNLREPSQRIVDKQVWNNENLANGNTENDVNNYQSPRLLHILQEVNTKELETRLAIDTDINVEKAEACAKELEDICNMLKKKHEEAKEIFVRAVVNNNNLLMLNHPIYEEKIHMVQKFAALLMSK